MPTDQTHRSYFGGIERIDMMKPPLDASSSSTNISCRHSHNRHSILSTSSDFQPLPTSDGFATRFLRHDNSASSPDTGSVDVPVPYSSEPTPQKDLQIDLHKVSSLVSRATLPHTIRQVDVPAHVLLLEKTFDQHSPCNTRPSYNIYVKGLPPKLAPRLATVFSSTLSTAPANAATPPVPLPSGKNVLLRRRKKCNYFGPFSSQRLNIIDKKEPSPLSVATCLSVTLPAVPANPLSVTTKRSPDFENGFSPARRKKTCQEEEEKKNMRLLWTLFVSAPSTKKEPSPVSVATCLRLSLPAVPANPFSVTTKRSPDFETGFSPNPPAQLPSLPVVGPRSLTGIDDSLFQHHTNHSTKPKTVSIYPHVFTEEQHAQTLFQQFPRTVLD